MTPLELEIELNEKETEELFVPVYKTLAEAQKNVKDGDYIVVFGDGCRIYKDISIVDPWS